MLTAAHCVCAPKDPRIQVQLIDGSDCVTSATIMRGLHGAEEVIQLEGPAKGIRINFELPKQEVAIDEQLTLVGFSGGPCFRETPEGRWLVGINSGHANAGTVSWFTSTFHFRAWIAEQVRKGETN